MKHNFLITSTGRTATKWLATLMNKSELWSVYHEPRGYEGDTYDKARKYFSRDYYGEVNGALHEDYYKFPYNKAVIRRDTKQIATSFANRYEWEDYQKRIQLLHERNNLLRSFRPSIIEYSEMTSDLDYLRKVFRWFGIYDYVPTVSDLLNRINENREVMYHEFNDLPQRYIDAYFEANILEL